MIRNSSEACYILVGDVIAGGEIDVAGDVFAGILPRCLQQPLSLLEEVLQQRDRTWEGRTWLAITALIVARSPKLPSMSVLHIMDRGSSYVRFIVVV